MERRIARAGGHRSDDEARALNARIAKLTEILEGVTAEHAMLLEQVRASTWCRLCSGCSSAEGCNLMVKRRLWLARCTADKQQNIICMAAVPAGGGTANHICQEHAVCVPVDVG
jgi:hypothetical protein